MRAAIRKLGNSSGVILPKSVLADAGISTGDTVDISSDEGRIILTPTPHRPRAGWAEASKKLAASGDDALVWPEFSNTGDSELEW